MLGWHSQAPGAYCPARQEKRSGHRGVSLAAFKEARAKEVSIKNDPSVWMPSKREWPLGRDVGLWRCSHCVSPLVVDVDRSPRTIETYLILSPYLELAWVKPGFQDQTLENPCRSCKDNFSFSPHAPRNKRDFQFNPLGFRSAG